MRQARGAREVDDSDHGGDRDAGCDLDHHGRRLGPGGAAALMLGAHGALVGTRFFATAEALGGDGAKQRIVGAAGDDTLRTRVFDIVRRLDWPEGYTDRALANRFTRAWHGHEATLVEALGTEAERYEAARTAGDLDTAVVFAGEGVDLIGDCPAAAEVVRRMAAQAEALLARA